MQYPKILFEDQHLCVLSKPAGLLSQGEKSGEPNLVDWLRQHFGRNYVGLIHRLDRNTSGVMVVAKRTKAAQRLSDSLQKGELKRTYLGWLVGRLSNPVTWKHWLLKNKETNEVRVVGGSSLQTERKPVVGAKEAVLTAKPIALGTFQQTELTLAEFELETGRSHQIRVQAAYEGVPLLGDRKYGSGIRKGFGKKSESPVFSRIALHSHKLEFPHPMTKEILHFVDPLPPDLAENSGIIQK